MSLSDVLPYVPIVILIVTIIGIVVNHLHRKSDKIRRIIIELIKTFINPTIDKLTTDSGLSGFEFPDSLNYQFGIQSENNAFRRFPKRKFILRRGITRYNDFCNEINGKITSLSDRARQQGVVKQITNGDGVHLVLTEKYEDYSRNQTDTLLQENNLMVIIVEIENLEEELSVKANKLLGKLEKLRDKWKRRYYLLESDF